MSPINTVFRQHKCKRYTFAYLAQAGPQPFAFETFTVLDGDREPVQEPTSFCSFGPFVMRLWCRQSPTRPLVEVAVQPGWKWVEESEGYVNESVPADGPTERDPSVRVVQT